MSATPQSPVLATTPSKAGSAWHRMRLLTPGTALSAVIALAATSVSTLQGGPQRPYALLLGVAFHYLSSEHRTKPGIEFCGRGVLRLGVGLLGARITAARSPGWAGRPR